MTALLLNVWGAAVICVAVVVAVVVRQRRGQRSRHIPLLGIGVIALLFIACLAISNIALDV